MPNGLVGGKPYRRETPHIPSHQGPLPKVEDKPIRMVPVNSEPIVAAPELTAPSKEATVQPRALTEKAAAFKAYLEAHGPQSSSEVEKNFGMASSNVVRMIKNYPDIFKMTIEVKSDGFTRYRLFGLVGQEAAKEEPKKELINAAIRFAKWSDGGLTISTGIKEIHLSKEDVTTMLLFIKE